MSATRRGVALKPWNRTEPELKLKRLCAGCNNGWMSRLEERTKPILVRLLENEPVLLDLDAQAEVARWAIKTAMVVEGVENIEHHLYSTSDRVAMRERQEIPTRTMVWLATLSERDVLFTSKTEHWDAPVDARTRAMCVTIAFGSVALQVFTMKLPHEVSSAVSVTTQMLKGPWLEATARIWPHSVAPLTWPLTRALTGETELDQFANRFKASAVPDSQSIKVVV
jgi:hypothetical protein